MIDYLKKYNLTDNDITNIKQRYNSNYINHFEIMMDNVSDILSYLNSIGVSNLLNVILYRPDICFRDLDYLKEQIAKYDQKLVLYMFNNDIEDLINFEI